MLSMRAEYSFMCGCGCHFSLAMLFSCVFVHDAILTIVIIEIGVCRTNFSESWIHFLKDRSLKIRSWVCCCVCRFLFKLILPNPHLMKCGVFTLPPSERLHKEHSFLIWYNNINHISGVEFKSFYLQYCTFWYGQ